MADLPGRRVALFGRFHRYARAQLAAAVKEGRGQIVREINDRTSAMIVGRGAIAYADTGDLDAKLAHCRRLNISVLSEREAAEALHLAKPFGVGVPVDLIAARSNLTENEVALLRIFDVVAVRGGEAQFRDLEKAQMVNALLDQGKSLPEIIRAFHQLDESERVTVTTAPNGDLAIVWGGAHATLSGQGLLPLDFGPPIEELFETALEAETTGDLTTAKRLYEICVQSDKRDPVAAFNLGNVLMALGETKEAALQFNQAVARDGGFAEAHYNLGLIADSENDARAAAKHFARAINAMPDYADALYNYGLLEFRRDNFDAAAPLFSRFVELEPDGRLAQRAKKALMHCGRE